MCTDCISSLSEATETDRYSPFVIAINDTLEKLECLNIQGLKRAPEGPERIIFLVNHPNEIPIQSGEAASHRKPDIVITRLSDAAQACPSLLLMKDWGQLKNLALIGVRPRSFHTILSCVELKTTRTDRNMTDCFKDDTTLLDEMDPMHLIVDGRAIRATRRAEKEEGQVESQVPLVPLSGSESSKRARETHDAGNDGEFQPQSAKRVSVEFTGPLRSWYPRTVKESPMAPGAAQPRQTTGSGSPTRTPQEKTSDSQTRDPILQLGSYAVEMLSVSRVHIWNILIIGTCICFGRRYPF